MCSRVVVLGAGDYLGCRVADAVATAGHDVTAVSGPEPSHRPSSRLTICDGSDPLALRRVLRGADCVINAATGRPDAAIGVAAALRSALQRDELGRIVHVSSLSVFGQGRGFLHEGIRPVPAWGHRAAHATLHVEKIISPDDRLAARILILRPGCIYGAGAPIWVERIARLLQSRRLGWLGERGQGACQMIHVDDLAQALREVVRQHVSGTCHFIGPELVSWNDYFFRLGALIGALPLRSVSPPRLAAEILLAGPVRSAICSKMAAADRITPSMRRLFGTKARIVSVRAPFMLGAAFRPLREGWAEAANAFLRDQSAAIHRQSPSGSAGIAAS